MIFLIFERKKYITIFCTLYNGVFHIWRRSHQFYTPVTYALKMNCDGIVCPILIIHVCIFESVLLVKRSIISHVEHRTIIQCTRISFDNKTHTHTCVVPTIRTTHNNVNNKNNILELNTDNAIINNEANVHKTDVNRTKHQLKLLPPASCCVYTFSAK